MVLFGSMSRFNCRIRNSLRKSGFLLKFFLFNFFIYFFEIFKILIIHIFSSFIYIFLYEVVLFLFLEEIFIFYRIFINRTIRIYVKENYMIIIGLFFIYCCLKVSSDCSKHEETFYSKGKNNKKNL